MAQKKLITYGKKGNVSQVVDRILSPKKKGYKKYSTLSDPYEWEEY